MMTQEKQMVTHSIIFSYHIPTKLALKMTLESCLMFVIVLWDEN